LQNVIDKHEFSSSAPEMKYSVIFFIAFTVGFFLTSVNAQQVAIPQPTPLRKPADLPPDPPPVAPDFKAILRPLPSASDRMNKLH
jgi:hypothetical protein